MSEHDDQSSAAPTAEAQPDAQPEAQPTKADAKADRKARKADKKTTRQSARAEKPKKERRAVGETVGTGVNKLRTQAARIIWAVCVLLASVLAAGALCIALDANRDNSLVTFLLDLGDSVDLGVFSRQNGIKEFTGENRELKNALFNWGLGAVAWLVIGRVLDRVVRP